MYLSWQNLLKEEMNKNYFKQIEDTVRKQRETLNIFPEKGLVFNSFNFDYNSLKLCLIAQDPYYDYVENNSMIIPTAHGLAFSSLVKVPPSLKNIYKEIKNEYSDYIIPNSGDLTHWKEQGVLLLNSMLTVVAGRPASHANIGWETFTDRVIKMISNDKNNIVFMLWGNFAKSKGHLINQDKHLILEGVHPSPLSAYAGFFGNNHFKLCNEYLKQNNKTEIKWQKELMKS